MAVSSTPSAPARSFVGRDAELHLLRESLATAVAGQGRLCLLTGEPGIGKTRLADELTTIARAGGAVVLWGRCWEGAGAPTFYPWLRVIRSYADMTDTESLRRDLGSGAADVAHVVPEVVARLGDQPPGPVLDVEQARFRLFDAIAGLMRAASRRAPLVLVFDDLHWADLPSLLLLRFLARDLHDCRLLVVATCRDLGLAQGDTRATIVAEIAREGTPIPLRGLDRRAVAELIARTAETPASAELVAVVHERTDGNPFFLGELIPLLERDGRLDASLPGGIPPGIRATIRRRVEGLSMDCRRMLTLAAVIGREFDRNLLSASSGTARGALSDLVDEARAAQLVGGSEDRPRFTHALVRETLYEEISTRERSQLHRAVGEALETLAGASTATRLSELAHHFFQASAGPGVTDARTIDYAERAGAECTAMLAHEDAATHYERALQLIGDGQPSERVCGLLLFLADARMRAGARREARATYVDAIAMARALGRPDLLAEAVLGYGRRLEISVLPDATLLGLIEDALAALGPARSTLRARLLGRYAVVLYGAHAVEQARAVSAEALAMAESLGDAATLAGVLASRQVVLWGPDALEERTAVAERITRLAMSTGNRDAEFAGHLGSLTAALERGDVVAVDRETQACAQLAADLRQPFYLMWVPSLRAMRALMEGRIADAERAIDEARALGEQVQSPNVRIRNLLQLHLLRRAQGRLADVEGEYLSALEWYPLPGMRARLAGLYAELDRLDDARASFEPLAADGFGTIARAGYWMPAIASLAEACAALGDARRAEELYALLLPYAGRTVVVNRGDACDGAVDRYLGLLATTMERFADAERHFEQAISLNARLGARLLVAHTERDLAELLRRRGSDDRRARGLLERAIRTYRALELPHFAERSAARTTAAPHAVRNVFRREGDVWTIGFDERALRLKDTKGLRYIARLIGHPGQEYHVIDLAGAADVRQAEVTSAPDQQARTAYRRRLEDVREQLEEAERFNDVARSTALREEMNAIAIELAGVYGLRGARARGGAERIRKAVTKCIRDQIAKIATTHAVLGRHLANAVRTGAFCAYVPEKPVDWEI